MLTLLGGVICIIVIVWLPLLTAIMWVSSKFVLALYPGVTPKDTRRQLWTLITGINYPYQVVEDGEVTVTKPAGIMSNFGGPGIVVIKPGNAVVFERGGTCTKIEGPGVTKTQPFERIKQVVDLRRQWDTIQIEDVQTRDGVPSRLKAGVGYQIEPLEMTDRRLGAGQDPTGPFDGAIDGARPVHKNNVYRAAYMAGTASWQDASCGAVELALRDAVGTRTLAEIYGQASDDALITPTIVPELEQEALNDARAWALEWGVAITWVDIITLEAPEEVRNRILKQREALANGEAKARVQDTMATVQLGMQEQAIEQLRVILDILSERDLLSSIDGPSLAAILQPLFQPVDLTQSLRETQLNDFRQRFDKLPEMLSDSIESLTNRLQLYEAESSKEDKRLEQKIEELRQGLQFVQQYEQGERAIRWQIVFGILATIFAFISFVIGLNWLKIAQLLSGTP